MDLSDPVFHDQNKAREWLEAQRWPHGPSCPHCGNADPSKITRMQGKAHRSGLFKCNECREQFTVTVGTVMERSKIPLTKWALAMFLMGASKKGVSAHQIHRTLKLPYNTTWFLLHRIREAMRDGALKTLGGSGKIVEADETYYGDVPEHKRRKSERRRKDGRPFTKGGKFGPGGKRAIIALVERGGNVRTFHVAHADKVTVGNIVMDNIDRESRLHTDESRLYFGADQHFASHETVKHSVHEYVRGDVHTNSAEGYFSIFKRGMRGVYQHCAEKHLHRYLAEFDFRYNNRIALGIDDTQRAAKIVQQAVGKRLMYQRPKAAMV